MSKPDPTGFTVTPRPVLSFSREEMPVVLHLGASLLFGRDPRFMDECHVATPEQVQVFFAGLFNGNDSFPSQPRFVDLMLAINNMPWASLAAMGFTTTDQPDPAGMLSLYQIEETEIGPNYWRGTLIPTNGRHNIALAVMPFGPYVEILD